jgi:hypothetical protein
MLIVGSKSLSKTFGVSYNDIDIIGSEIDLSNLIKSLNPKRVSRTDYIATLYGIDKTDIFDTNNIEVLLYDNSNSLKKYMEYENAFDGVKYASLEVLLSLKKSHIHFPYKFDKHIKSYSLLLDHLKYDRLSHITSLNFKETEYRLGKLKTPSLNKKVNMFFDQSTNFVKSYFVHDDMHLAVSHYDRPLYERMQKDKTLAICDKLMWEGFSFDDKCKCILEEAYVISLERKILPMIFGGGKYYTPLQAFNWSLMRICTTLCSGWFRQFATDNYFRVKEYYNDNYVSDFLEMVDNGYINKI